MEVNGKELFVFDTEDDSKGNIYWIVFYNGRKYYTFNNCAEAFKFITEYPKKIICFAVNLEYDIINTFRGNYEKIRWLFGKSRLISVRYKKFIFYDTLNHWKFSVAQMGKYIKAKKLPFNPQSLKYCKMDCKVTYDFVLSMLTRYNKLGFKIKSTLPSTVYNFWLTNHSPFRLGRIDEATLDTYKHAYYGGRTECFFIGKLMGKIHTVDVNSLYPYVMTKEYPNPYIVEKKFNLNAYGLTHARVEVKRHIPVLPYRTKTGKLIYPEGRFSGWWTNDELRYSQAKILKVYDSYTFPVVCYSFKDFITSFYDKRRRTKDELLNMTYKISMNSLYGKFGQGREKTNVISLANYVKNKRKLKSDNIAIYGNIVIYSTLDRYPINTNMLWAIYTTSFARIYLHKYLELVNTNGGRLLYCDTDSIFYKADKAIIGCGDTLGGFKSEGIYKGIEVKLPKLYRLIGVKDKIKAKGVPKKSQDIFFDKGEVSFQKPIKFKESLRRNLTANMWVKHTKTNNYTYDKGVILNDGTVKPLNIVI